MSSDLESNESGSLSLSLNDDFAKFLEESLSTSSNISSNGAKVKPKVTAQIPKPKVTAQIPEPKEEMGGSSHNWLKKKIQDAPETAGEPSAIRLAPEPKVQVLKKSDSISEKNAVSEDEIETGPEDSPPKSSEDEENLSFEAALKEAIDHSLQGTPPEEDYSSSFENSEGNRKKLVSDSDSIHHSSQLISHSSLDENVNTDPDNSEIDGQSSRKSSVEEEKPADLQINLPQFISSNVFEEDESDIEEGNIVQDSKQTSPKDELFSQDQSPFNQFEITQQDETVSNNSNDNDSDNIALSDEIVYPEIANSKNVPLLPYSNDAETKSSELSHYADISREEPEGNVRSMGQSQANHLQNIDNASLLKAADVSLPTVPSNLASASYNRNEIKHNSRDVSSITHKVTTVSNSANISRPSARNVTKTRGTRAIRTNTPSRNATASRFSTSTRSTPKSRFPVENNAAISNRSTLSSTFVSRGRGRTPPRVLSSETDKFKRELNEQEHLLKGFQAENEKLYEEMKLKDQEIQEIKAAHLKEKEQLAWQLGKAKENIRFLEFGKRTTEPKCNSQECEHFSALNDMKRDNLNLKQELNTLKTTISNPAQRKQPVHNTGEDAQLLRRQLAKTEKVAADLQQKLTKLMLSENSLRVQLNAQNKNQTSSHTVSFLEDQLKKVFQFQESHDEKVKALLDDMYQQQEMLKVKYLEGLKESEEAFLEEKLGFETKLKEAECRIADIENTAPIKKFSKCIQCDIHPVINAPKGKKVESKTENKSVQCYLMDESSTNSALEIKELKLRIERITIEQEDYRNQIKKYLMALEKKEKSPFKNYNTEPKHSTEHQLRTTMESQQVLLEQVQRRLEFVQGQWEQLCHENVSLKDQLQQAISKIIASGESQRASAEASSIVSLERKIAELEKRHGRREEELQGLQYQASNPTTDHLSQDVARLQEHVLQKNQIIFTYRHELDTIISFLYQLQQQYNTVSQNW